MILARLLILRIYFLTLPRGADRHSGRLPQVPSTATSSKNSLIQNAQVEREYGCM